MSSPQFAGPGARAVLLADAVIEAMLAALCLVLAAGALGTRAWLLPPWLTAPVFVVIAVVLLVAAAALGWLSLRPDATALLAVAAANAVTALAALAFAVAGGGAGPELRLVLAVIGVVLGGLAAAQLFLVWRASRDWGQGPPL